MKYTIDEYTAKKLGMPISEVFLAALIKVAAHPEAILKRMLKEEKIIKDPIKGSYYLTQKWDETLQRVLLSSEKADDDGMLKRETALAEKLREIFPEGKKAGTASTYYRSNTKDTALKLSKFFKIYGDYTDEQVIEAAKKYVASFNGNYKYMRALKYFIWKNDRIYTGEQKSDLANILENMNQDTVEDTDISINSQLRN